jgi:hypothetical protein
MNYTEDEAKTRFQLQCDDGDPVMVFVIPKLGDAKQTPKILNWGMRSFKFGQTQKSSETGRATNFYNEIQDHQAGFDIKDGENAYPLSTSSHGFDTTKSNLSPSPTQDSDAEDCAFTAQALATGIEVVESLGAMGTDFGADQSTDSPDLSTPDNWSGDGGQFDGAGASSDF